MTFGLRDKVMFDNRISTAVISCHDDFTVTSGFCYDKYRKVHESYDKAKVRK